MQGFIAAVEEIDFLAKGVELGLELFDPLDGFGRF
jgi:hypothetical protein